MEGCLDARTGGTKKNPSCEKRSKAQDRVGEGGEVFGGKLVFLREKKHVEEDMRINYRSDNVWDALWGQVLNEGGSWIEAVPPNVVIDVSVFSNSFVASLQEKDIQSLMKKYLSYFEA